MQGDIHTIYTYTPQIGSFKELIPDYGQCPTLLNLQEGGLEVLTVKLFEPGVRYLILRSANTLY